MATAEGAESDHQQGTQVLRTQTKKGEIFFFLLFLLFFL
jgi:hypothetical protein